VEQITAAVRVRGRLEEDAIARIVVARSWGPGRFRAAVRAAIAEGRVVRVSRRVIGPPDDDAAADGGP